MAATGPLLTLIYDIGTRDGTLTKDSKVGNLLIDNSPTGPMLNKRPGLVITQQQSAGAGLGVVPAAIQGPSQNRYHPAFMIADLLYPLSGTGAPTSGIALPSNGNSGIPYSSFTGAILKTSVQAWVPSSGFVWALLATGIFGGSGTYPVASFAVGDASLDTVFYLLGQSTTSDSTVLWGSAPGDPTTWPLLNYLVLDGSLGQGMCVITHLSYVLALCRSGCAFFYDAGISPGLPLAPVQNAVCSVGCAEGFSVAHYNDVTYFLAGNQDTTYCVGMFTGLGYSRISTPAIDKILNSAILDGAALATPAVYGYVLNFKGCDCYVLQLLPQEVTLVYNINTQIWTYFSTVVAGVEGPFASRFAIHTKYEVNGTPELLYGLDPATGAIYSFSPTVYQDMGQPINCFIRTPPIDQGTYAVKFCAGAYLHSDTISTTVSVTYSNDDYQTFAVSRNIDMSTQKKQLIRVGSYRHRSWDLLHTDNTPFRVAALELDLTDTGEGDQ